MAQDPIMLGDCDDAVFCISLNARQNCLTGIETTILNNWGHALYIIFRKAGLLTHLLRIDIRGTENFFFIREPCYNCCAIFGVGGYDRRCNTLAVLWVGKGSKLRRAGKEHFAGSSPRWCRWMVIGIAFGGSRASLGHVHLVESQRQPLLSYLSCS